MIMLEKYNQNIVYVLGFIMTLFHLVVLNFYPLPANYFRTTHLLFVLLLVFLLYPLKKGGAKGLTIFNVIFFLGTIASMGYAFFELENILYRFGIFTTNIDIIMGILAVLIVLEATRRSNGFALPIIATIFILYALSGNYLPGMIGHSGYSIKRLITSLYTYDGIFGTALDTAATYVVMFIIFAAFLERTGAGEVFMKFAEAGAGGLRGGPAKMAVIACALFGTISGSAVACVAATGSLIIPLMIKKNYGNDLSAAVVASAAIGGQIMPPVMAAGAFLMAEFLNIPYNRVIQAAIIPALMYFFTIWLSIDCIAAKHGLVGLSKEERPKLLQVLKKDWLVLMPLLLLIVMLVVFKYSPIKCAFYSMIVGILICIPNKERRMRLKDICDTLVVSAKGIAPTACACACAGIVIGVINLTGLGLKISTIIISFSGGNLLFSLLLSMVTAIIFGMGLPTTVSYLLCVSVLSPVLIELGITPLAAHMFIFYFACLSGITPPVALAAYTAAGIAGTGPVKTASEGCKLAIIAFFVPYMFVYNTAFLMDGSVLEILWAILVGGTTCYAIAGFVQGYFITNLNFVLRMVCFVITILLLIQNTMLDLMGLVSFAMMLVFLLLYRRKKQKNMQGNIVSEEGEVI